MTINLKNFLNTKPKLSKMGEFQELKPIDGLEISSFSADLYKNGRDDLALFYFKDGANYAAMYTSNSIVSQTIEWNKKSNKSFTKALLVNTKNANTFTGDQGVEGVDLVAKNLSRILTIRESKSDQGVSETVKMKELIFASTGVIGEKFPAENIVSSLQPLVDKLRDDHNKLIWIKTASAIMTTDTKPKVAYEEIVVGNTIIKLAGVAKGSGMIAPNLATMLSFIFTDADLPSNILKSLLKRAVASTFNSITIDSDKSTNDMVAIFSTRKIKIGQNRSLDDPVIQKIEMALKRLCENLAKQIVVDGEGAKKFVTVKVKGAKSLIGRSVWGQARKELSKVNDEKIKTNEIKRLWLHQANKSMNDFIGKKVLGRVPENHEQPNILQDYANTSSAGSIIAFSLYSQDMKKNEIGVLCSFGAGYSAGSVILKKTS